MSNLLDKESPQNICSAGQCSAIQWIIEPKEKDLGGFFVRRLLPAKEMRRVGPWIFFDHMGPATFPKGQGINVRPHPHINLATVTYLFEGEILHRDSVGSYQPIRPGDVNLMVAGSGIVHSERERPEVTSMEHNLHGLQLWMALPEEDEETDPAFYHYPDAEIPAIEIEGVPIRVIMGNAYGVSSPVKTFAQTLYIEAHLRAGQTLTLPNAQERGLYIAEGQVTTRDTVLNQYSMTIFAATEGIEVRATQDARIALIGGEKMGHRHMYWNFASSRKDRIEQAKQDWLAQRFNKVHGDEDEFIPLP